MTNHAPVFTSSSATGSFNENSNTTGSAALHQLSGTMNFKDSDSSDTHTTSASLSSAVLSSGSIIPASSLAHFQTAMSSQILTDNHGTGSLKWSFSDADNDFDFLAKDQKLTLTYNIKVSDNHGGFVTQTVKITVTGTDDKPVVAVEPVTIVTEQADHTLSLSPDIAHITLDFTDPDLTNTGHTASVTAVSATGNTAGLLPGSLGTAELMAFFHVDNVVKNSGSSTGTINTTFAAPDLAFDYLAAGEQLNIAYTVQLDDHAGGVSTQTVNVTVVGTNDAPVYLCGPEVVHLTEDQDLTPAGDLHAHGDLLFADIDLSDTHTTSTTVTASLSGGGSIPLSNAALLAAFSATVQPDSTNHLLGDVDWNFTLDNDAVNFLQGGQTLTLVYHVQVDDGHGGTDTQDVTVTILGNNHPVIITSGPQTADAFELAGTTGSAAIDTTTTTPSGTLDFTDTDTGDAHTVTVALDSASTSLGGSVPGATQTDLGSAVTTVLHDSTGTGTGSIDWTFAIADHDLDFLGEGETLTVNYNVSVKDATTTSTQTVSVTVVGANDDVVVTGGPGSASGSELANTTDSPTLDVATPTGSIAFTDVDLSDSHFVITTVTSAVWSANPLADVPPETLGDLQTALATVLHDSTGSGSGSVDWSFAIPDRDLDFLSAGETLTVTYDVAVSDGFTTSSQTVTVTLSGADDPLVATPVTAEVIDSAFTDANQIVASGLLADLAHPIDLSSSRAVTEVNGSSANVDQPVAGTYGTLVISSDGHYSYTANASIDPLQAGDNPTDQFTFTIADNHGNTTTTTLTFNITGGNDNPIITAATASGSITEDAGPTVLVNGDFETGNLSGWTTAGSGIGVEQLEFGGGYGHYTAHLGASAGATLSQDVSTTPGQHYFLSFTVIGDTEASSSPLSVSWDGVTLLSLSNVPVGVNQYTFDVIGDASLSTTSLQFSYADDGTGLFLDQVSVNPATGPATESTDGSISFSDVETADTHTASFVALGGGYLGTFSLDPVSEAGGSGSVAWHYSVNNSDIQFLAAGESLTQDYQVTITDDGGAATAQTVSVTIVGTNDAPTAVGETIISDAGAPGLIDIPTWALAMNDTDPDTTDHVFVNSIGTSTGGSAIPFGDIFFSDDATAGGSFTYNSSDGTATSGNFATATVVNLPTSTTSLVGTGGDDIIIATGTSETMSGGGGNDVLIGASGSHVMDGGSGNDGFAFLNTSAGPGVITDFNNTTESDHIVISANGFGGGLMAGMDVTTTFETSADDQFSGFGAQFHFDTANQTLYYSADGTQASAVAVTSVQSGVTINPHDLLIDFAYLHRSEIQRAPSGARFSFARGISPHAKVIRAGQGEPLESGRFCQHNAGRTRDNFHKYNKQIGMKPVGHIIKSAAALAALVAAMPASAAWEPTKPVEIVVAAGAGGASDQMARMMQAAIQKNNLMKQPMVVSLKGGASGAEALMYMKSSDGDANKVLIAYSLIYMLPLSAKIPFNWRELTPVSVIALDQFVLWDNASGPKSVKEFIAAAKAASAPFKMGGTGSKREDHVLTVFMEQRTGAKFSYLPYKSGGEAATQLVGGHTESNVNNPSENLEVWRAGQVRALCVFDKERIAYKTKVTETQSWNDIPTCKEEGLDVQYLMLRAMFLPGKVTPDQQAFYVDLFQKVTQTTEYKDYMEKQALKPIFLTGKDMVQFLEEDDKINASLMNEAGFVAK